MAKSTTVTKKENPNKPVSEAQMKATRKKQIITLSIGFVFTILSITGLIIYIIFAL